MKITKRALAIGMTAVALAGFGCMSAVADEGNDEQIVLEFWLPPYGNDQFDVKNLELFAEYEAEHPNIKINYTPLTWDNWYQSFTTAIASGTVPDLGGGNGYAPFEFYTEGAVLPLDDLFEGLIESGEADDMLNEVYKYLNYDGHYVGLPWNFSLRAIGVNTDLLKEAGVEEIPSTWDEFKEACRAVVDNTDADGFVISGDNTGKQCVMGFLHSNDGGLFTEDLQNNVMCDQNIETLQFLTDMANEGLLSKAGASMTYGETQKAFESGKVAFVCSSTTYFMSLTDKYDWVDLCNPLQSYQGKYGTHVGINSLMVFSGSKHPQEAKEFALWWTKNNYRLFSEAGTDGVPTWSHITQEPFYQESRLFDKVLNDWLPIGTILSNKGHNLFPELNAIDTDESMFNMAQGVTLGVDPHETLQAVSDAVDAAMGY